MFRSNNETNRRIDFTYVFQSSIVYNVHFVSGRYNFLHQYGDVEGTTDPLNILQAVLLLCFALLTFANAMFVWMDVDVPSLPQHSTNR